jgi:twinkle protein
MYYDKLSDLGIKLTRHYGSEKTKCPKCHDGRKNKQDKSLSVNITTGEYNCHNTGCDFKGNVRSDFKAQTIRKYEKPPQDVLNNIELRDKVVSWFAARSIAEATLQHFKIFCKKEWMPQTQKEESCICFPYIRDADIVNIKFRDGAKNFKMVKDAELIFFNLNSLRDRKKAIVLEGEIDCMAAWECGYGHEAIADEQGVVSNPKSEYAVLSVPNGASKGNQRIEYLDNCAEWFLGVEEIIVATDGDDAGVQLKDELIRRFGVERCRFVVYPSAQVVPLQNNLKRRCKDLNEVKQYLGVGEVDKCITEAQAIPIEGIHYVEDIFPAMLDNFRRGVNMGESTHIGEMDDYFRWKFGDVNLWTGYANAGKTTWVIYCMLVKSIESGWKWGIFSPENYPANDFYDDIVEMYCGKWLDNMGENEYTKACEFINQHFFYVYPDDEHDISSINEKFRYLVMKKGINGVLLDPWNQLDHVQKAYEREDQYISRQLKDIKRFALHNKIIYNIIAHPIKPQKESDKSYPVVEMYDISGGSMWGNKTDSIISYYRPNSHVNPESPEVEVHVKKIKRKRTGGKKGMFEVLHLWAIKRFVDPMTRLPYCDPYKENIHKQDLTQSNLWYNKDDKPKTDDDLKPDEDDMPF